MLDTVKYATGSGSVDGLGQMHVPQAGLYLFAGTIVFGGAPTRCFACLWKNHAEVMGRGADGQVQASNFSIIVTADNPDDIQLVAYAEGGSGSWAVINATGLVAHWLGPVP